MESNFLPEHLQQEYKEIRRIFLSMQNVWARYVDETIPTDRAFAKRIIAFIINVLTAAIRNFATIDREAYRELLVFFEYEFLYGPAGDYHNYLAFDETDDGTPANELLWELRDGTVTISKLKRIRSSFKKIEKQFD